MNSSELLVAFRAGVGPELSAKLSDDEVWRMADDAYRTFVRLTGGIADFTTVAVTQVAVTNNQALSALHPSILRIMRITRQSDNGKITVVNQTELGSGVQTDYGQTYQLTLDDKVGVVRYGVIGMERNKIRWINIPEVDDVAMLQVYRLPLTRITKDGQDLSEVDEIHHYPMLDWMYYLATRSPDSGAQGVSEAYRASFTDYCARVKAENERYKAKVRVVKYGGL